MRSWLVDHWHWPLIIVVVVFVTVFSVTTTIRIHKCRDICESLGYNDYSSHGACNEEPGDCSCYQRTKGPTLDLDKVP